MINLQLNYFDGVFFQRGAPNIFISFMKENKKLEKIQFFFQPRTPSYYDYYGR